MWSQSDKRFSSYCDHKQLWTDRQGHSIIRPIIRQAYKKRVCCALLNFCFNLGLFNISGHITTVPACNSGTLTNVLPLRNGMPQTQDIAPHPFTVYRHGTDLSLCYPLTWNFTLEYTATHFNILGETRPGNPSLTFHTQQQTLNLMQFWW